MSASISSIKTQHRQRGAVLIVALIMLLLLTMIGLAGIRDTQLQEKMAGGAQDRELALQAAEAALRAGELSALAIAQANPNMNAAAGCALNCGPGFGYIELQVPPAVPNLQRTETTYWQAFPWNPGVNCVAYNTALLANVATPPCYIIEKLPAAYSSLAGTVNGGAGGTNVIDFLITARGTGTTNSAVVILQSVYRFHN